MPVADPFAYAIDLERYRRADHRWLDDLDGVTVHAGPPHQRMGTRAVAERDWLPADEHTVAELALRRRLVDEAPAEVHLALPGSDRAGREVADTVHAWLSRYRPGALTGWRSVADPLVRAGLAVQEDLCVMERTGGRWRLTAGLVCFPTYWRLGDKIGRDQADVHGPVPHYADDLAAKVDRFFDRLVPGKIAARRNWGFSAHPLLFAPDLAALGTPASFEPGSLWLRSERQTLCRLPRSGAVLFTIRVQLAPAAAIEARPALAARLAAAIDGWTPELVASRGGRHGWIDEVRAWLGAAAIRPG
ncbi:MAG: DUF3445 domain-containing protein [Acidimicrobiia bacterium]|nr:DUF3445 domain-containing protein [Acidimicrobiia bacterium]